MSRIDLTEAEMFEDFGRALGDAEIEAGCTVGELVKVTKWDRDKVRELVRVLIDSGRWEHLKVKRRRINGVVDLRDAYRPVRSD